MTANQMPAQEKHKLLFSNDNLKGARPLTKHIRTTLDNSGIKGTGYFSLSYAADRAEGRLAVYKWANNHRLLGPHGFVQSHSTAEFLKRHCPIYERFRTAFDSGAPG